MNAVIARLKGWKAHGKGLDRTECPYDGYTQTDAYAAWVGGWDDAHELSRYEATEADYRALVAKGS